MTDERDGIPCGLPIDAGATVQAFAARHVVVQRKQTEVIRGLLDLHRGLHRVVDAVPDLCFSNEVARCQRMIANTLQAAATGYLALHGRRMEVELHAHRSLSEHLLAVSRENVERWFTDVAGVPVLERPRL